MTTPQAASDALEEFEDNYHIQDNETGNFYPQREHGELSGQTVATIKAALLTAAAQPVNQSGVTIVPNNLILSLAQARPATDTTGEGELSDRDLERWHILNRAPKVITAAQGLIDRHMASAERARAYAADKCLEITKLNNALSRKNRKILRLKAALLSKPAAGVHVGWQWYNETLDEWHFFGLQSNVEQFVKYHKVRPVYAPPNDERGG